MRHACGLHLLLAAAAPPALPAMTASPAAPATPPAPQPAVAAAAPRILVVGSGAIGSFYGAIAHRGGAQVSVVCRSDLAVVREQGLRLTSPLGELSFRPAAVYGKVADCPGGAAAPEYLLLCVKVLDGLDRAALIQPALGPHTRIVLIQNGIGIEDDLARAFPGQTLISALAFIGVSRVAPGVFEHQAYGMLTLGRYPQGTDASVRRLADCLTAGGIPVNVSEQVLTERWRKTVWNAAFNPLSVLAGGADTRVLLGRPEGEALVRALMAEVCQVAAACGHALPSSQIDDYIASTQRMPPYRNSMALDLLAGRPVELEAILGNVLAAARRSGVAVPRLETVYAAVRLRMDERANQA